MSDVDLNKVVGAYLSPDKKVSLSSALSHVGDLDALVEAAKLESVEISGRSEGFSDEDVARIEALSEIIVAATSQRRSEQIAQSNASRVATAARNLADAAAETKSETKPEPELVPEPVSEPAPVVELVADPEPVSASASDVAAPLPVVEQKQLVGAGPIAFSALGSSSDAGPVRPRAADGRLSNVFAADSGGGVSERKLSDVDEVVGALASTYRRYLSGAPGTGVKHVVAAYKRPENETFSVYGYSGESDMQVIDRVASMPLEFDRHSGQFAAGWCAPEETLYEFCPQISSSDGLVDIPQVTARRGSLQYTTGPDFGVLFANAAVGQILTEAQVIAATPKTCIEIDCPSFQTATLDVNPLCVTGNLLTQAGYPEYNQRFISEVMMANLHKINGDVIGRMATASTAVTLPGATGPVDTSSASWFLDATSRYATYLRSKYRTVQSQVVEVVAPYWYRQQMVSDLSRRSGVDLLTSSDRLAAAFAERGIRVQWVYDWQMAGFDTPAEVATGNQTAQVLVYLPGTFVKAVNPVIDLGVIHSQAQLSTNQYTALFVEEGYTVIERCYESLALTVPTCASGTTGALSGSCDTV